MAEKTELKVASSESVAFELALDIASKENIYDGSSNYRKELLDLYAECLVATKNNRVV